MQSSRILGNIMVERTGSSRRLLNKLARGAASAAIVATALSGVALAADDPGFLGSIKRHSIVGSTVPANGDQNPYAVVISPVTSGKLTQGHVVVDNFNDKNNLQ